MDNHQDRKDTKGARQHLDGASGFVENYAGTKRQDKDTERINVILSKTKDFGCVFECSAYAA